MVLDPDLLQALVRSEQRDRLRETGWVPRAAGLRGHPTFAARLIESILSEDRDRPRADGPGSDDQRFDARRP